MKTTSFFAAATAVLATSLANLNGAAITLTGPTDPTRTATLSDAQSGKVGEGNATAAIVSTALTGTWIERGSVEADDAPLFSDGMLDIDLTPPGAFGGRLVSGTWTITNANFWTSFGMGAISLHVGGGQGTPDHFIWKLTDGAMSGTWSYDGTAFNGGGLSNLKLYSTGNGTTRRVPDGGTTIALLGMALLGLGGVRKALGKA